MKLRCIIRIAIICLLAPAAVQADVWLVNLRGQGDNGFGTPSDPPWEEWQIWNSLVHASVPYVRSDIRDLNGQNPIYAEISALEFNSQIQTIIPGITNVVADQMFGQAIPQSVSADMMWQNNWPSASAWIELTISNLNPLVEYRVAVLFMPSAASGTPTADWSVTGDGSYTNAGIASGVDTSSWLRPTASGTLIITNDLGAAVSTTQRVGVSAFAIESKQPTLHITNSNGTVGSYTTTYDIGGTNAYLEGVLVWTNAANGSNGTVAESSPWTISSIPLAYGTNLITVSGTNAFGALASDSVSIIRTSPGLGSPIVDVTTAPTTVVGPITSYTINGTNNVHVVGTMSWTNSNTGGSGSLAATASWQVADISLGFGTNVIAVSGSNLLATVTNDAVTIVREGLGAPFINIDDPGAPVTLSTAVVSGTNNGHVVGTMTWTNALTGSSGSFGAAVNWGIPDISISIGTNVITVSGTNAVGAQTNDILSLVVIGDVVHVDQNSPAPSHLQDGLSWATAFEDLQDGIGARLSGQDIWVAEGVYYPDEAAAGVATVTNNDVSHSFTLSGDVVVYGGFTGSETNLSQRSPISNVCIMSGDIQQDDANGDANNIAEVSTDIQGQNSLHVIAIASGTPVVDGFVITAGYARGFGNEFGGGVNAQGGTPEIFNSRILGNRAEVEGGGIQIPVGATVSNSVIAGNSADLGGGGIAISGAAAPVFTDCVVSNNASQDRGGAVLSGFGCQLQMIRCTIVDNAASFDGGGIYAMAGSPVLRESLIAGNVAGNNGGGLVLFGNCPTGSVVQCLITGNSAASGGGIYLEEVGASDFITTSFDNCTLSGNKASGNGGAFAASGDGILVSPENCIIWNNESSGSSATAAASIHTSASAFVDPRHSIVANFGGVGISNFDVNPLFVTPLAPSTAPSTAGDFRLQFLSPCINAGTNRSWMATAMDLDGNARIHDGVVDRGAYEAQYGLGAPDISISTSPQTVAYVSSNITIQGTFNTEIVGDIIFSNQLTGAYDPVTTQDVSNLTWTVSNVPLSLGTNVFVVTGTNALGILATDSVSIVRSWPPGVPSGTWLHYSFDTDFADSSGNGNDAILFDANGDGDAVITNTAAEFGAGGFDMGDSDDSIALATAFTPSNGEPWTISFWAHLAGGAAMYGFSTNVSGNTILLRSDSGKGVVMNIGGHGVVQWTNVLGQHSWHHYTIVANGSGVDIDGVEGDDALAVYIDGKLETRVSGDVTSYGTDITVDTLGDGPAWPYGTPGHMDEFWIFNRALTHDEVCNMYQFNSPESQPVLRWAFEEGSGSNATESVSGETMIASLSGAVSWVAGIDGTGSNAVSVGADAPPSYVSAGTLTTGGAYVSGTNGAYRVLTNNWTMTGWVRLPAATGGGDRVLASSVSVGPATWWLWLLNSDGGMSQNLGFDFNSSRIYSGIDIPKETNVFVSLQVDSTATSFGAGMRHRYAVWDGASWHFSEGAEWDPVQLHDIEIGSFAGGQRQFEGVIDDLRIYDVTLCQDNLDRLTGADSDGDLIPDYLDNDDDNDGISDGAEKLAGTNSKSTDTDGDGVSDYAEWVAGSDPVDGSSFPLISGITVQSGELVFEWPSVAGRMYTLWSATNLVGTGIWQEVITLPATPSTNYYTNATPSVGTYYRLDVSNP